MLTGFAAKSLAGCYFNSGRVKESVEWYKKGLEYMLGSGEETEDLAMSYEKVARCYTWTFNQDFDKAEQYFRRAEEIRTRLKEKLKDGGTEKTVEIHYIYDAKQAEIRIGENYMEMGRMFQIKNDYFKALHYAELFEEILLRLEKENSSSLAYAYYDKSICYYNIGISYANIQPDEAKNICASLDQN